MVMGKLIKCLYCGRGFGVEWYTVFISAREVFENMNCGLIVLWVEIIAVWSKECENRCNIRMSASCKLIDAANNALYIMVMGKLIKCFYCGRGFGVEWYTVFISAREVFESMNFGLIVLWMGIIYVWGKECENRFNVRTSASCNPIDADNNYLIDLSSTRKIMIKGINWSNGINGEAGAIWCHIWNLICIFNWELSLVVVL